MADVSYKPGRDWPLVVECKIVLEKFGSTQFLRDKALYHIEVTTLHWNPFLSVGGEREDLHSNVGDLS